MRLFTVVLFLVSSYSVFGQNATVSLCLSENAKIPDKECDNFASSNCNVQKSCIFNLAKSGSRIGKDTGTIKIILDRLLILKPNDLRFEARESNKNEILLTLLSDKKEILYKRSLIRKEKMFTSGPSVKTPITKSNLLAFENSKVLDQKSLAYLLDHYFITFKNE